jgi:hypothetical protein
VNHKKIKPVQILRSKQGPARTERVNWKMPGIILPNILFPIHRIKPSKNPRFPPSIRPIPTPMVMNYLPIQILPVLSNPQKRLPRQDLNPDFYFLLKVSNP